MKLASASCLLNKVVDAVALMLEPVVSAFQRCRASRWTCQSPGSEDVYTLGTEHMPRSKNGRSNPCRASPPGNIVLSIWFYRSTSKNTSNPSSTSSNCKEFHSLHKLHACVRAHKYMLISLILLRKQVRSSSNKIKRSSW